MIPDNQVRPAEPWPRGKRIAFRFALPFLLLFENGLYLVLWFWPWLLGILVHAIDAPQHYLTLWAGTHIFYLSGVAATQHPTGSGDTALGWIGALIRLVLALVVCLVWSLISEIRGRRLEYNTAYAWLRLVMRFILAAALFGYGFLKIFPLQMPYPSAATLGETYGASSPMRLAWTFLGASWQYRIFAGTCEVIPAILLCFRRTSTLGALGAAAVMLNVFVMNLGYDIPVKLYSFELLLLAIFLLLPDIQALVRFFLLRQPAVLTGVWVPKPERRALRWAGHALQVLVIGFLLYDTGVSAWKQWHGGQNELNGQWDVQAPTGAVADLKWQHMDFQYADRMRLNVEGKDKADLLSIAVAKETKTLQFLKDDPNSDQPGPPMATLHWTRPSADTLQLSGTWEGKPAAWTLQRTKPTLLMSRGFHWVQEYPFNR